MARKGQKPSKNWRAVDSRFLVRVMDEVSRVNPNDAIPDGLCPFPVRTDTWKAFADVYNRKATIELEPGRNARVFNTLKGRWRGILARALAEDEDSIPGGQVEPNADNARVREIYERSRAWFHVSVGGPRAITRAAPKAPLKAEKADGGGGGGGDDESNDDTDGGGGGDNVGAVGAAASWEKNKKKRQAEEEEEEEDVEEEEEDWGEPRSRINVRDYKRQRAQAGIPNQGAVRDVEDELRAANERGAAMKEIIRKSDDRDYQLRVQALEEFRENSERDHRLRMQALEELRENRKRDQQFKMRFLELEMSRGENANAGNQGLAGLLSGNLPPELREGLLRFLLKDSDGGGGGGASSTDP